MLVATFDDQEMSVLDASDEFHLVVAEMSVEIIDELSTVCCSEMSSVMVLDFVILSTHRWRQKYLKDHMTT